MRQEGRWYIHTDEIALDKIRRYIRKDKAEPVDMLCVDGVVRRLLEINISQKNRIIRQSSYLRIEYTLWYDDGHRGVRPFVSGWRVV